MKLLPWEYGVRNMMRAPLRAALGSAGSFLVVLLVLAAGAFVAGMQNSLNKSANPNNFILMGTGSQDSLERSQVSNSVISKVQNLKCVKSAMGVKFVSPESVQMTMLKPALDTEEEYQITLRGVKPAAFLVHPGLKITAGRAPRPGQDEMMLGKLALSRLGGDKTRYAVGKKLYFDDRAWTICGHFEAPNTVFEAEAWLSLTELQIATKRTDGVSGIFLTMDPEKADLVELEELTADTTLQVVSISESEYYQKLSTFFKPVRIMVWVTAILIAAGGLLGGLNTMYASFAARVREMGSLQALGYPRRAIVLSLVQESILTSALGTLAGACAAILLLDGIAVNFASGAFELQIDGPVLGFGLLAGLCLGAIGAIPPAIRCLKMPIPQALKSH